MFSLGYPALHSEPEPWGPGCRLDLEPGSGFSLRHQNVLLTGLSPEFVPFQPITRLIRSPNTRYALFILLFDHYLNSFTFFGYIKHILLH